MPRYQSKHERRKARRNLMLRQPQRPNSTGEGLAYKRISECFSLPENNRIPLMNTFTFLTFTRPLAILSDVSAVLLKRSFTFISHFMLKKIIVFLSKRPHKSFLVSDNFFILIIMPDYNYSIFIPENT